MNVIKNIFGLIVIGMIAVMAMSTGCIDSEPSQPIPTPTPTPTNDDEAFLYFCNKVGAMSNQTGALKASLTEGDRERIIVDATNLETLAETYLKMCEEFQVSEEMHHLWITVRDMLDEIRLGASDFKRGVTNRDIVKYMEGFDHFENAERYAREADELMKNL
jgi:hypothetical protein